VRDLAVNLAASVIAGVAVWLAQHLARHHRAARRRAFFGLSPGEQALLVVARHWSSNQPTSVHQRDVAALVELASIIRECGARADLAPSGGAPVQLGRVTEFCVGGPTANERMVAHMAALLPGIHQDEPDPSGFRSTYRIGDAKYAREPGRYDYAILARTFAPGQTRPIFLLPGQTAVTNLAAARYLAAEQRQLLRRYGVDEPFCLVLRVLEPNTYGADLVELVADVTAAAQAR
jgi:hypothetical protein